METHPPTDADTPDPAGGLGGGPAPDGPAIRDTRLAERALRESWPIPEKYRGPLIGRLLKIALDKDTSPREATSAAKAILSASKLNLEAIAASMRAAEHEELLQRLEELERRTAQGGDHR